MKSILGIGNALTDILAVLPDDSLLREFHLPVGSMQHVDRETGNKIWQVLKAIGAQYVAGGAAGNTITGTAVFGMPSGFIGKVGDDEIGALYRSDQERNGIRSTLLIGKEDSGRASVFITPPNAERTFATYLGAALELCPEDLRPEYFHGYDYFFIEGYLVQNQQLLRQAVKLAKEAGCYIAIDMASYNVVESNDTFLHDIVEQYVDIVFANETEAETFTRHSSGCEDWRERIIYQEWRRISPYRGISGRCKRRDRRRRPLCCRIPIRPRPGYAAGRVRQGRLHHCIQSRGGHRSQNRYSTLEICKTGNPRLDSRESLRNCS